ncbi:DUF3105 domain-containing protein [Luteipulveratus sp. YIM 133132]|uniref:DUF3105 domain-containing protein n=1 Tax=Luteipulveratus flavus TaxID=3031728 RepID=A0ABT6C6D4_9MICO|nr:MULTISPECIES: DUF3105 domain-containing protein [unclassified Luteipulveratus]MDE9364204.1 DUF3105 domain-containing protein [Luteipulveratus sp. YIM 133132]MDF8263634.1 DUF3105 domain-containing protein [Luteipulveratus sp. YIM 133296]
MSDQNESSTGSAREDARAKLATMQKKQSRQQRRGGVVVGAVVALVIIALVGAGAFFIKRDQDSKSAAGDIGVVKTYKNLKFDHVQGKVSYPQNPPVGGNHNPAWANCGIYDKVVPNEHAVHSLEHGAVWITYKPGSVSTADINLLKGKARTQSYILMSQDKTQSSPIVLSAWGKQMHLNSARDKKIDQFLKDYVQGPQTREPGAACSGAYDPNTGQTGGGM